jgi:hypothetical protein
MKPILSILFFFGMISLVNAQSEVTFAEKTHSFGKIKQHVPVTYVFSFTNSSTRPVVIENAEAECGCTKPEYIQGAIMKGKKSEIKVTYNAENSGSFKKNVTVKFAGLSTPYILTIEGEVIPEKK